MTETPTQVHRALRFDQAVMRWRAQRVRDNGYVATLIPYTGYGSTSWIRVLARVVLDRPAARHSGEAAGGRGWRNFTKVPVEGAEVEVRVGDHTAVVTADDSGIVDAVVPVSLIPGWHEIGLSAEGSPPASAQINVIDPDIGFGMVSDIDDTVMVTALPRPLLAAWHTFVVNEHARATTPGMPVLYERLTSQHPGAPVIYLSTGAWNVAPTLTRFLSRNLYPRGALLLTDWGPTPDRWFRSGREHKRSSLERLAKEFPDIRWLLVGDDGQHDEAIYGAFVAEHAEKVAAVCIRQLSPGEAVLAGAGYRDHNVSDLANRVPWLYASDGAGLAEKLDDTGLLNAPRPQPEVGA